LTTSLPDVLVRQRDPHYSSDRSETLKAENQAYSWQNLLLLLWMKPTQNQKHWPLLPTVQQNPDIFQFSMSCNPFVVDDVVERIEVRFGNKGHITIW